ncbi:MAG: AraC family transcriptional regulator ligand-binding domain-containing protein [Gammaproteobacteria bacterium]
MELDTLSLQEEIGRVAGNWFAHIEQLLHPTHDSTYKDALRRVRITPADLQAGREVTFDQLDTALRFIRQSVPDVTLRMMDSLHPLDLGVLGYAMLSSSSVGNALRLEHQYHELTTDRFYQELSIAEGVAVVRPVPRLRFVDELRDIAEDSIGGTWRLLRDLLGPEAESEFREASVQFAYPEPEYGDAYRDVFRCKIAFNADETTLRFPAPWLGRPVQSANDVTADVCTAMCERLLGPGGSSLDTTRTVRRLLLSRPGRHMLHLDEAAEHLHLSPNQLRKRLYRAGTSYKKLVLEVRMALARHYLEATLMSISDIAYLLDYSQPAPFIRAFRKYTGMTPVQCRKAAKLSVS